MAGIGFMLKKLFSDETLTNRGKAYLYSSFVVAGPWIAAVITVNILIIIMGYLNIPGIEKDLFMGTIVYSFVFSQIITAPWQFLITRYISDKLFVKKYDFIRPSYMGVTKIVFFIGLVVSSLFYYGKELPFSYKLMSVYLFLLITMIWIIMVFLSAVKNYELISKAFIYGGLLSAILIIIFINYHLPFSSFVSASNLLLAYLLGMSLTFIMLLYNFLSTFNFGNKLEFDFLRYLSKYSSLFFIGLFYTSGLWIDDILMWFSNIGVIIYDTYIYAPIYDNAVFLAYLTIIPSMVLFLVSVETEFYDHYKEYYGLANEGGTFNEIDVAKDKMKKSVYRQLIHTFEIQALISVTIVLLSPIIFNYLNISILVRNIFRVTTFGALFNIFVLLIILVLLYFEIRKRAVLIAIVYFVTNFIFTYYFSNKGLEYLGVGFLIGSFTTFILATIILATFIKKINYVTFALQPLFSQKEKGFFVLIADMLNVYYEKKSSYVLLRKDKKKYSYYNNDNNDYKATKSM